MKVVRHNNMMYMPMADRMSARFVVPIPCKQAS